MEMEHPLSPHYEEEPAPPTTQTNYHNPPTVHAQYGGDPITVQYAMPYDQVMLVPVEQSIDRGVYPVNPVVHQPNHNWYTHRVNQVFIVASELRIQDVENRAAARTGLEYIWGILKENDMGQPLGPKVDFFVSVYKQVVLCLTLLFAIVFAGLDGNQNVAFNVIATLLTATETVLWLFTGFKFFRRLVCIKLAQRKVGPAEVAEEMVIRNAAEDQIPRVPVVEDACSRAAQFSKNILAEILLYPIIVCDLYGLVSEQVYQFDSWKAVIAMLLLVFASIELVFTYCVRVYFLIVCLRIMEHQVEGIQECGALCFGGIQWRYMSNLIGNVFVFLFMLVILGFQIHVDNVLLGPFQVSGAAIFMIICTVLLPISNVIIFLAINMHAVMELLYKVDIHFALMAPEQRAKFRNGNNLFVQRNANGAYYFIEDDSASKLPIYQARLQSYQEVNTWKRFTFGLSDKALAAVLFIWTIIYSAYLFTSPGLYNYTASRGGLAEGPVGAVKICLWIAFGVANAHAYILGVIITAYVTAVLIAVILSCVCRSKDD